MQPVVHGVGINLSVSVSGGTSLNDEYYSLQGLCTLLYAVVLRDMQQIICIYTGSTL